MSLSDELSKLQQLRDAGSLSDEEFATAKAKLLADSSGSRFTADFSGGSANREMEVKNWAFFLHLSHLSGYLVPIAGWVMPIVIWQIQKEKMPELDVHGKNAVNWMISKVIYLIVSAILCIVFIGIPMLMVLLVCDLVFPIIAAIKAREGEAWKYPGAISFLT